MKEWIEKHGTSDRKALIDYANSLIMHYGEASGAMACELYDSIARASGVTIPSAEPAPIPKYGEVAKAVNGALKVSEKVIPSVVARMTKQVGADTILHNAGRDEKHGAQFAWIATGDSCKFCLMLASRGWQYMSKASLKNGHAEHIHGNCDCQYAIRFNPELSIEIKENSKKDDNKIIVENNKNNGTIKPDKIISGHESTPKIWEANKVIDRIGKNNVVSVRTIYDSNGMKWKDIHTDDHGNPKEHNYGEHGEHVHIYEWLENGRLKNKTVRELTDEERREHGDII